MEDIAQKAGVSKATVYNYFPTKESLLIGTANEVVDKAEKALLENADMTSDLKLRHILKVFVTANMNYPQLARRITYLSSFEENELYKSAERMMELLRRQVVQVQEDGIFIKDADPDDIVNMLMGLYYIVQFQRPDTIHHSMEELETKLDEYFSVILEHFYAKKEPGCI